MLNLMHLTSVNIKCEANQLTASSVASYEDLF